MKTSTALAFFALFAPAQAACPNGCSNHGTCGNNDACQCHATFIGADCSQRQCMSYKSWIATGQGDLNYDGDTDDATVFQTDTLFTKTSLEYVATQLSPHGSWEKWPSKFSDTGEAHFYMECSNRGLCNRESGECECFEGYTGEACRRTQCPDNCNGRGLCLTVGQQKGANTYALWDHDMSRSCQCDPGFAGPSCAEVVCPAGDDPLTLNQQHAKQFVDFYALRTTDGAAAIAGSDDGDSLLFSGTATASFTDNDGEIWTTAPFSVAPTNHISDSSGTAAALEAALRALPGNLLEDVVVRDGFCGVVVPGAAQFSDATTFAAGTTSGFTYVPQDGEAFVCPGVQTPFLFDSGGATDPDGTTPLTASVGDALTCEKLAAAYCTRLTIKFGGANTGEVPLITFNTDMVTVGSESDNNELNYFEAHATAVSRLPVTLAHATGGAAITYVVKAGLDQSDASALIDNAANAKTITMGAGNAALFGSTDEERIKVTCGIGGTPTLYGTYTVASSTADAIVVKETIPDCPNSGGGMKIELVTDYIAIDADLRSAVALGDRITYSGDTGGGQSAKVSNEVISVRYDVSTSKGFIYLDNEESTTATYDFSTSGISEPAHGDTFIQIEGKGTSEKAECSSRGVCDSEKGECICFQGYTGYACNLQNSLSA